MMLALPDGTDTFRETCFFQTPYLTWNQFQLHLLGREEYELRVVHNRQSESTMSVRDIVSDKKRRLREKKTETARDATLKKCHHMDEQGSGRPPT